MNFFLQKKNMVLLTAITSIVLGVLTLILAGTYAFPWINTEGGVTATQNFVAFIAIAGLLTAAAEIVLGAGLCAKAFREKLAVIIPLFVLISAKLLLVIVSTVIFGFRRDILVFYILGLLLILLVMSGFIFSFFLNDDENPRIKQKPAKEKHVEKPHAEKPVKEHEAN